MNSFVYCLHFFRGLILQSTAAFCVLRFALFMSRRKRVAFRHFENFF